MKKWCSIKNVPAVYTAADLLGSDWDALIESVFDWPQTHLGTRGRAFPEIDVYEGDEKIVVKAEVPGMSKEDIKVRLEEDHLVLSGEKKEEQKRSEKGHKYLERRFGSFKRVVTLPKGLARAEKVSAAYKDGILTVEIPKSEEVKEEGKDIEIK